MSPCCTSLLPCLSIIPGSQLHTCLSSYLLLSKCSLNLVTLLLRKEKKRLLAQKNAPEMYCMHTAQPTEFHDPKLLNLTPPLSSVLNAGSCRTSTQPSGDHSMETRQRDKPFCRTSGHQALTEQAGRPNLKSAQHLLHHGPPQLSP